MKKILIVGVILGLSNCGVKGDLYLPSGNDAPKNFQPTQCPFCFTPNFIEVISI